MFTKNSRLLANQPKNNYQTFPENNKYYPENKQTFFQTATNVVVNTANSMLPVAIIKEGAQKVSNKLGNKSNYSPMS